MLGSMQVRASVQQADSRLQLQAVTSRSSDHATLLTLCWGGTSLCSATTAMVGWPMVMAGFWCGVGFKPRLTCGERQRHSAQTPQQTQLRYQCMCGMGLWWAVGFKPRLTCRREAAAAGAASAELQCHFSGWLYILCKLCWDAEFNNQKHGPLQRSTHHQPDVHAVLHAVGVHCLVHQICQLLLGQACAGQADGAHRVKSSSCMLAEDAADAKAPRQHRVLTTNRQPNLPPPTDVHVDCFGALV